jgi:hypothetical protein
MEITCCPHPPAPPTPVSARRLAVAAHAGIPFHARLAASIRPAPSNTWASAQGDGPGQQSGFQLGIVAMVMGLGSPGSKGRGRVRKTMAHTTTIAFISPHLWLRKRLHECGGPSMANVPLNGMRTFVVDQEQQSGR